MNFISDSLGTQNIWSDSEYWGFSPVFIAPERQTDTWRSKKHYREAIKA